MQWQGSSVQVAYLRTHVCLAVMGRTLRPTRRAERRRRSGTVEALRSRATARGTGNVTGALGVLRVCRRRCCFGAPPLASRLGEVGREAPAGASECHSLGLTRRNDRDAPAARDPGAGAWAGRDAQGRPPSESPAPRPSALPLSTNHARRDSSDEVPWGRYCMGLDVSSAIPRPFGPTAV